MMWQCCHIIGLNRHLLFAFEHHEFFELDNAVPQLSAAAARHLCTISGPLKPIDYGHSHLASRP